MTETGQGDPVPVPGRGSGESPQLVDLAHRLDEERPSPRAAFQATLRSALLEEQRRRALVQARVRLQIAAYSGSGVVLLAIGALGVSGSGPLAPG
jgi:hypothetical protein